MDVPTDQMLAAHPRVQQALQTTRELATAHVDAAMLAIAEQRICQLLGAETPASNSANELVPDDLALAVVAFVEQWVIDVANVSDDMVATLRIELGEDRLMDFMHAVLVIEQRVRLELAWVKLGLSS